MAEVEYKAILGYSYLRLHGGAGMPKDPPVKRLPYELGSLNLEPMGDKPVYVVLTYPGDWAAYCADDLQLEAQLDRLVIMWRKKWGPMVGYWVKEFQLRGAPHLNLFVGWPHGAEGYLEVLERGKRQAAIERNSGRAVAKSALVAVEGEFGWWLRTAWSKIVTGNDGSDVARLHHGRGVDVRANFFSNRAEEFQSRALLAWYIGREVGKARQKVVPDGFGKVRHWWGSWGLRREDEIVLDVTYGEFERLRSRVDKWRAEHGTTFGGWRGLPGTGATAWGVSTEEALAWVLAEEESEADGLF